MVRDFCNLLFFRYICVLKNACVEKNGRNSRYISSSVLDASNVPDIGAVAGV